MARVNKVILGTHSVMANGGLLADAGTRLVASTAKLHMTPVVVVTGIYTVSPVYPFDPSSYIEYGDPSKYIEYEDAELMDKVEVENPLQDYVPPELIDLFISNMK
ncbi:GCD complex subunit gcd7 [Ascosphaera atra]|nr:GCD complex subunit gcd7 [Ascosphaera atra]